MPQPSFDAPTLQPTAIETPETFAKRRAELLGRLGSDSIAIFRSAPETIRNSDVHHAYRQCSDVYYLAGFEEPESTLILAPGRDKPFILLVRARDRQQEIWTGRRAGPEGVVRDYGADEAFDSAELTEHLGPILDEADLVYFARGRDRDFDRQLLELLDQSSRRRYRNGRPPTTLAHPAEHLDEMRLVKTGADLEALRRATEITVAGHREAMRFARPGRNELEVQAVLEYTFRRLGSPRNGYPSIVASGDNATILHYIENRARLAEGELLLIDAGAEWGYFTGDVTRTFPPGGRFQGAGADLYDAVLSAEQAAIDCVRPGMTVESVHLAALHSLADSLLELGLLEGTRDEVIESKSYRRFYMHRTSHWLGMDVHDVGRYKEKSEWRPLVAGMVLTVEPGLYIAADDESVAPAFRGLGIRIEDDVLVTADGVEVLTAGAPRERAEVEALTAG